MVCRDARDVRFIGIRFANCVANESSPITIVNSEVSISNCIFEETSGGRGGAILLEDSDLSLEETTFNGTRSESDGSAIMAHSDSEVVVNDCIFVQTSCAFGGSIALINDTSAMITNSSFSENVADQGGAIFAVSYDSAKLEIENCEFRKNHANQGGAVFVNGVESVVLSSVFDENKAEGEGGALKFEGTGDISSDESKLLLKDCVFENNKAGFGGAAIIRDVSANITISKFRVNRAETDGGALYIGDYSEVLCEKTDLTGNRAQRFGGAVAIKTDEVSKATRIVTRVGIAFVLNSSTCQKNKALHGGCLYSLNEIVINMTETVIRSNIANQSGGGIIFENGKSMSLRDVIFQENAAKDNGGGLRIGSFAVADSEIDVPTIGRSILTIDRCIFRRNRSLIGGGMSIVHYVSADVIDSIFEFNSANNSGAFILRGNNYDTENSTIHDFDVSKRGIDTKNVFDEARESLGSPVNPDLKDVVPTLTMKMTNTSIQYNQGEYPAGIGALNGVLVWIRESTFSHNKATNSVGAAYFFRSLCFCEEVLFYNNSAGTSGGAITLHVPNHALLFFSFTIGDFGWRIAREFSCRRQFPKYCVHRKYLWQPRWSNSS